MVLAIIVAVVIAVAATLVLVERDYQEDARQASLSALAVSRTTFDQLRTRDTVMLSAVLDALASRSDLRAALAAQDRPALERLSAAVFSSLKQRYGITHLYFISPDGHVVLRAHQPQTYGDLVARATFLTARRTGGYGTGLELGKTAYALRVVHAVSRSGTATGDIDPQATGVRVGYIEVGEEIGHFLAFMRERTAGDRYVLLLPKAGPSAADWRAYRAQSGLPDDWNRLADYVVAGSTQPSFTVGFTLPKSPEDVPSGGELLGGPDKTAAAVSTSIFPIFDASGRRTGIVVAQHDLAATLANARETQYGVIAVIGSLMLALAIVIPGILNRLVFRRLDRLKVIAEQGRTDLASRPDPNADEGLEYVDEISRFEWTLQRGLRELRVKSELLDSVTDVIYVHDLTGRIFYANKAASTVLGYSHPELLTMNVADIVPPETREIIPANIERIVADKRRRFESYDITASGDRIPVEVHSQTIEVDDTTFIISVVRDLTERRKAERTIERLAYFDPLTGVANRRLFQDRLEVALAQARRTGSAFAIVFVDVDKLKPINDTLGHASGDAVLREVARRLSKVVRDSDTVARLGGDEFGMLLLDTDEVGAARAGERIAAVLAEPMQLENEQATVSASAGIAVWDVSDDPDSVLRKADVAMYRAKELGPAHWLLFDDEMLNEISEHFALMADLRAAFDSGGLDLHYQPQVDLVDGRVVGAEALCRWTDEIRGSVPPSVFIALAEEDGLVVDIGRWAIDRACADMATWRAQGLGDIQVSVNISAKQFLEDDLAATVDAALSEYAIRPGQLALEITESIALSGSPAVAEVMGVLSARGVPLIIDDFGVGYSALDRIADLPIAALKIDRGFVERIGHGAERDAIVRTIIDLGTHLRLDTIAEGVEQQEQVDALSQMGCRIAQGFLFAKAMPSTMLAEFVRARAHAPESL